MLFSNDFANYVSVDRLCQKLPIAKDSMLESRGAFDELNSSADPAAVKEWEQQEATAQAKRDVDPEAMDIYDLKIAPGKIDASFVQDMD